MKRMWIATLALAGTFLALLAAAAQQPGRLPLQPPPGESRARGGDAGDGFDDFGPPPGNPPPGKRGKQRPGEGPDGPGGLGGPGGPGGPFDGPPRGRGGEPGRPDGPGGPGRRPGMLDGRGPGPRGGGPMLPGGPPGFDFGRLEQDDPEMYKLIEQDQRLDAASLELAAKVRTAKAEDREKLRAELMVTVGEHFNVRQARRELQLKRMDEELKRLRAAIETRNKGREEIVAKRLTELVGDPKDLEF